MTSKQTRRATLSSEVVLTSNEPPKEFRIFPAGAFDTLKGTFLFDDKAAAAVMKAVADYGNDYCLDYNHASINAKNAPDPAEAGKSAGWYRPELRNGELWATNVEWTPLAQQKLKDKEYRYISPTFDFLDDGSVVELINIALTCLPATKSLTPLMASRESTEGAVGASSTEKTMTPEMMAALAKALGLPETAKPEEIQAAALAKLAAPATAAGATAPMKCAKCSTEAPANAKFCAQCAEPLPIVAIDDDDEAMPEPVKAALARQRQELDRVRKQNEDAQAELARIRDAQELSRFETEAGGYKALGQDPKKLGSTLMALSRKAPDEKKVIDEVLKRANAALSQSDLLKAQGHRGNEAASEKKVELDRLIDGKLKENAKLTRPQAVARVLKERPDLYAAAQE